MLKLLAKQNFSSYFNQYTYNQERNIYNCINTEKAEVIADDSGLCIDALDGWPGVFTHRFLGEDATEQERNEFILEKMKDLPLEKRGCSIICVIAYVDENGELHTFTGEFKSKISFEQTGDNFFGFDSIVYKDEECKETIASLSNEEKLKINARSLALQQLQQFLSKKNEKIEEEGLTL